MREASRLQRSRLAIFGSPEGTVTNSDSRIGGRQTMRAFFLSVGMVSVTSLHCGCATPLTAVVQPTGTERGRFVSQKLVGANYCDG
jgi:hypothetical protein